MDRFHNARPIRVIDLMASCEQNDAVIQDVKTEHGTGRDSRRRRDTVRRES